jgi:hypothetical protein
MRRIFSSILHFGESMLDQAHTAAEVADYLAQGTRALVASLGEIEARHSSWRDQAYLTLRLLDEVGYLDPGQQTASVTRRDVLPPQAAAEAWSDGLAGRVPISRDGVAPGTSSMLASLLESEMAQASDYVIVCIERIMRHVELHRTNAFPSTAMLRGDDLWVEKHQAAILLTRAGDILNDMRYLNSALKLNDFAFRAHRRFQPDLRHTLFLRSLAEVELMLRKAGA